MTFEEAIDHTKQFGSPPGHDAVHVSSGVYAKEWRIKAGTVIVSHKHAYDHLSILVSGIAILRAGDYEQRIVAPQAIDIAASIEHTLYALTDVVWFCIHSLEHAKAAAENGDPYSMDGVLLVKEPR